MGDLFLFVVVFIIFLIIFMVDYFIKRKNKKLKKFIGMELARVRRENYEFMGIVLSFVNAFIISITGVLCTMVNMDKLWQIVYGFVLLTALIYIFYSIIGGISDRLNRKK